MATAKTIYCPQCKRKVATWDGKSFTTINVNCRNCAKRIFYYPSEDKTEIKNIPQRTTSSGLRFY